MTATRALAAQLATPDRPAASVSVNHRNSEDRARRQDDDKDFTELVGRSLPMRAMSEQIQSVAASHAPVLIHRETGSGTELVARAVHRESGRTGPFVAVNCVTIPAGLSFLVSVLRLRARSCNCAVGARSLQELARYVRGSPTSSDKDEKLDRDDEDT